MKTECNVVNKRVLGVLHVHNATKAIIVRHSCTEREHNLDSNNNNNQNRRNEIVTRNLRWHRCTLASKRPQLIDAIKLIGGFFVFETAARLRSWFSVTIRAHVVHSLLIHCSSRIDSSVDAVTSFGKIDLFEPPIACNVVIATKSRCFKNIDLINATKLNLNGNVIPISDCCWKMEIIAH